MNITDDVRKEKIGASFDAMWGTMLAMKETSEELPNKKNGKYRLETNSKVLGKTTVTKLLVEKLTNLSFQGVTVIQFVFIFPFAGEKEGKFNRGI